ncbi:MAG: hypothetical protein ACRDVK_07715 [Acidimicrobiia bacterium]
MEGGPTVHLHGIAGVMGEDEHVVVVGRFVPPPALPILVAPLAATDRAEHIAAHDAGADVLERLLEDRGALVHLAALLAVRLAPGGQGDHPVVELFPAHAERVLMALVRAGDEPVNRYRDVTLELGHRAPGWLVMSLAAIASRQERDGHSVSSDRIYKHCCMMARSPEIS